MVYVLKFGASFLLLPGIFIVLFAIVGVMLYRQGLKKFSAMVLVLTLMLYLMSTSLVAERTLGSLENVYEPPANPQGDAIIMLGGGALKDTPDVGGTGTLCSSPSARLLTTVRLYHMLHVPVVLSGGQVYEDSGPEAEIARRILIDMGVPEQDILVENKSINTRENAVFTSRILKDKNLEHPILVTSAFHMNRSVLNFQKEGVDVVPYPTDYMINRQHVFHYNKLMPQASALYMNSLVMQERLRWMVTNYLE